MRSCCSYVHILSLSLVLLILFACQLIITRTVIALSVYLFLLTSLAYRLFLPCCHSDRKWTILRLFGICCCRCASSYFDSGMKPMRSNQMWGRHNHRGGHTSSRALSLSLSQSVCLFACLAAYLLAWLSSHNHNLFGATSILFAFCAWVLSLKKQTLYHHCEEYSTSSQWRRSRKRHNHVLSNVIFVQNLIQILLITS